MTDPLLECRAITRYYDDGVSRTEVLKGLDLEVMSGSMLAIIGVSGSGKSTLLHLLGGLDTPNEGDITIQGQRINTMSETARSRFRNRHIGFIYQFHHLLGDFNVLENVVMPLLLRGQSFAKVESLGEQLLAKTGLKERAKHKPYQLSGGERQRVAICRAMITQPSIILADEPTGQLDRNSAEAVTTELLSLSADNQTALIFATHDQDLVSRLPKVYRIDRGLLTNEAAD